jgi:shikimate dehydrogenase
MHNAAFAALALDWVYVAFAVAPPRVEQAMAGVRGLGLVGLNVTIPHKQAVVPFLDELDQTARDLEAVNTIHNRDGQLIGYNTDGPGLLRAFEERGVELAGKAVVVLGAGGAARAVALACARAQAGGLSILNRTLARAEQLAELVATRARFQAVQALPLVGPASQRAVQEADVIIDCTSVGMYPYSDVPPVIPPEWLHPGQVVCDLTYNPLDTVLLKAARSRGAQTVDGTGMLVHQGAIAFEIWTGRPAPVDIMRAALMQALAKTG